MNIFCCPLESIPDKALKKINDNEIENTTVTGKKINQRTEEIEYLPCVSPHLNPNIHAKSKNGAKAIKARKTTPLIKSTTAKTANGINKAKEIKRLNKNVKIWFHIGWVADTSKVLDILSNEVNKGVKGLAI